MTLVERDGVQGKVCTKCKEWKPVERFSKRPASRDGYQSQCKHCNNAPNTERQPIAVDFKACTICLETKPVSEFYPKKYAYDGYRSACKQCVQAGIKESRERDIEAARERNRAWYASKRTERNETRRRFIAANLERHREYMREWREGNREKMREYSRKQYELYPERVKKANLNWEMRNPAKRTVISQRRRARLSQAAGSFTAQEWEELKARYGNICLRCGRGEPEVLLTPDHIIPIPSPRAGATTSPTSSRCAARATPRRAPGRSTTGKGIKDKTVLTQRREERQDRKDPIKGESSNDPENVR